jgi:hypothetical protein
VFADHLLARMAGDHLEGTVDIDDPRICRANVGDKNALLRAFHDHGQDVTWQYLPAGKAEVGQERQDK